MASEYKVTETTKVIEKGERVIRVEEKTVTTEETRLDSSEPHKKTARQKLHDRTHRHEKIDRENGARGNVVKDCLKAHNKCRREHGVEPLKLSTELCKYTEEWAKTLADKNLLEHGPKADEYGENIYSMWSNDKDHTINGSEAVEKWYEESRDYNYDDEPKDNKAGHFTQMVWKGTREIGIGIAKNQETHKIYLVIAYNPPGNIRGRFKDNVAPPKSKEQSKAIVFIKSLLHSKKTDSDSSSDSDSSDDEEGKHKHVPKEHKAEPEEKGETLKEKFISKLPHNKKHVTNGAKGDVAKDCLVAHNKYRKEHGVEPLKLNAELSKYSEEWARALVEKENLEHGPKSQEYGENIYCIMSNDPEHAIHGGEVIDKWYAESKGYDFNQEPRSSDAGHFTQVIWKETRELGVGIAKNAETNKIILVLSYNPPGNVAGSYRNNVLPLKGKEPSKAKGFLKSLMPGKKGDSSSSDSDHEDKEEKEAKKHSEHKPHKDVPVVIPVHKDSKPETHEKSDHHKHEHHKSEKDSIKDKIISKLSHKPPKTDDKKVSTNGGRGDVVKDCLEAHNKCRKDHGVEPLKLNSELMKYSEEVAKTLAEKNKLEHGPKSNEYGESIFSIVSSDPEHTIGGAEPIEKWYAESKDYNYEHEPKDNNANHFTQIVWKGSTDLGIGIAKNHQTNSIFLVLSYYPPGNVIGHFKQNVLPPKSKEPSKTLAFLKSLIPSKKSDSESSESESSSDEEDAEEILNKESVAVHNEYRAKHGVPPLRHSKKMTRLAKEWAEKLIAEDKLEHRENNRYGENLYCSWSSNPKKKVTARDAVASWYSEIKDHKFGKEPSTLKSGHFTQVVWKNTEQVGMALARNKSGKTIIVANYKPAGNIMNMFTDNVPKAV